MEDHNQVRMEGVLLRNKQIEELIDFEDKLPICCSQMSHWFIWMYLCALHGPAELRVEVI